MRKIIVFTAVAFALAIYVHADTFVEGQPSAIAAVVRYCNQPHHRIILSKNNPKHRWELIGEIGPNDHGPWPADYVVFTEEMNP